MLRHMKLQGSKGLTLLDVLVIFGLLVIVAAILFPVAARFRTSPRSPCQSNMKELATAMHMYWTDYNMMLPSSILHNRLKSKKWDPMISAEFCCEKGSTPPPETMKPDDVRWVQILYPHMKNKDIIWCTSDSGKTTGNSLQDEQAMVSYIYKPAVDRAWFGSMCPVDPVNPTQNLQMKCFRKEPDFEYVADQMVFFERVGWHWGTRKKAGARTSA